MTTQITSFVADRAVIMKDLVAEILHCYGKVFGGYARDILISSATKDSDVLPKDIDCVMHMDNLQELISRINRMTFCNVMVMFNREATRYLSNFNSLAFEVRHIRLDVSYEPWVGVLDLKTRIPALYEHIMSATSSNICFEAVKGTHVSIDVLVLPDNVGMPEDPFLTPIDFECNGWYLKMAGNDDGKFEIQRCLTSQLSNPNCSNAEWMKTVARVSNDTIKRIAVAVEPDNERIRKMVSSGFELRNVSLEYPYINENEYDKEDTCLLCLDELKDTDVVASACCGAKIHQSCYIDLVANGEVMCLICKTSEAEIAEIRAEREEAELREAAEAVEAFVNGTDDIDDDDYAIDDGIVIDDDEVDVPDDDGDAFSDSSDESSVSDDSEGNDVANLDDLEYLDGPIIGHSEGSNGIEGNDDSDEEVALLEENPTETGSDEDENSEDGYNAFSAYFSFMEL